MLTAAWIIPGAAPAPRAPTAGRAQSHCCCQKFSMDSHPPPLVQTLCRVCGELDELAWGVRMTRHLVIRVSRQAQNPSHRQQGTAWSFNKAPRVNEAMQIPHYAKAGRNRKLQRCVCDAWINLSWPDLLMEPASLSAVPLLGTKNLPRILLPGQLASCF